MESSSAPQAVAAVESTPFGGVGSAADDDAVAAARTDTAFDRMVVAAGVVAACATTVSKSAFPLRLNPLDCVRHSKLATARHEV